MKPKEYEFTLSDGSKRYEIVCERTDVYTLAKMHKAVSFRPVMPVDIEEAYDRFFGL